VDTITHSLTGLLMSRAGFNRVSPHATAILLLAANAPDLDAGSALGGSLAYIHWHRWIAHSFIAVPFLALAVVAVVRLAARKPLHWGRAFLIGMAGVLSHLLLDSTNAYGIRLLAPFSSTWYRLDITSLTDLWIGLALVAALAGPAISRLVSVEIGARPGSARGVAIFALCFVVVFDFARYALHQRAVATLDARLYANHLPLRVAAFPFSTTPLWWRGLVEGANFYAIYDVNLLAEFDPSAGRMFYKPDPSPAIQAASRTRTFEEFLRFSRYPLWQVTPVDVPENGLRVEAMDLRFGIPPNPHFMATAIVDGNLRVRESWFAMRPK
jgi:inner membrane protein